MTIRHIGYEPNQDLVRSAIAEHFSRTGERITKAYEENYAENTYTFFIMCQMCKKIHSVTVPGPGLYRYNQGDHVQVAFPDLSASDRELIMDNICDSCYDGLFPVEEEEPPNGPPIYGERPSGGFW